MEKELDAFVWIQIQGQFGHTGRRWLFGGKFIKNKPAVVAVAAVDLGELEFIKIGHNKINQDIDFWIDKILIRAIHEPKHIWRFDAFDCIGGYDEKVERTLNLWHDEIECKHDSDCKDIPPQPPPEKEMVTVKKKKTRTEQRAKEKPEKPRVVVMVTERRKLTPEPTPPPSPPREKKLRPKPKQEYVDMSQRFEVRFTNRADQVEYEKVKTCIRLIDNSGNESKLIALEPFTIKKGTSTTHKIKLEEDERLEELVDSKVSFHPSTKPKPDWKLLYISIKDFSRNTNHQFLLDNMDMYRIVILIKPEVPKASNVKLFITLKGADQTSPRLSLDSPIKPDVSEWNQKFEKEKTYEFYVSTPDVGEIRTASIVHNKGPKFGNIIDYLTIFPMHQPGKAYEFDL